MTLLEVCEPIFQYVCRLNRSARKGVSPEMAAVRAELKDLLSRAKAEAEAARLRDQYEKVSRVLVFFADFTIRRSRLPFAEDWKRLSHELDPPEMAYEQKFFEMLDAELADESDAARERLAVYYACIGLGFTGLYAGRPDDLRRYMSRLSARLRGMMDADPAARICEEAYKHTLDSDWTRPPRQALVMIGIVLAGMVATLLAANVYFYRRGSADLAVSLDQINGRAASSAAPAGGE